MPYNKPENEGLFIVGTSIRIWSSRHLHAHNFNGQEPPQKSACSGAQGCLERLRFEDEDDNSQLKPREEVIPPPIR